MVRSKKEVEQKEHILLTTHKLHCKKCLCIYLYDVKICEFCSNKELKEVAMDFTHR